MSAISNADVFAFGKARQVAGIKPSTISTEAVSGARPPSAREAAMAAEDRAGLFLV